MIESIDFSQIDAKENPICSPHFSRGDGRSNYSFFEENTIIGKINNFMEKEYLKRLKMLQNEIEVKYVEFFNQENVQGAETSCESFIELEGWEDTYYT